MNYVGKQMEYKTSQGEIRTAIIQEVVFHDLLNKDIYIGISPYGHEVKLSLDEINRIL